MILTNATVINPDFILENHDVQINEKTGIIENILPDILDTKDDKIFDCKDMWLFPGLIDIHVHLRDLNQKQKENYSTGAQAAVHGGYTTLFDMPNKQPPINNQLYFQKVQTLAQKQTVADIFQFVLVDEKLLTESFNWRYGKIYFGGTTATSGVEYDILDKVTFLQEKFFSIHAEDKDEINQNAKIYDNKNPKLHNKIRSPDAELIAVTKVIDFLKKHRNYLNRYHIAHVTLPETINMISEANLTNLSFEVTPHHMFLSENDIDTLGDFIKVNPPLRSFEQMMELRNLWINGKIPIIASDHAPHTKEDKIKYKLSGIPSLDTNLRLLLDYCIRSNISPTLITRTCSTNPALLMALNDRGTIEQGKKADLVLVNPNRKEIVDKIYSKCKWSPWQGKGLQGVPLITFKSGKPVFIDEKIDPSLF